VESTSLTAKSRSVAALAGRRIDADNATTPRFPLARVPIVRDAIADLLRNDEVDMLICSAACGADLVALQAATSLGILCRIVLPYAPEQFRRTSVVDRPGDWGHVYDNLVSEIKALGQLVVLDAVVDDDRAYAQANEALISQIDAVANGRRRLAIMVWDGHSHAETDATAEFGRLASAAGMERREVITCDHELRKFGE
jgi:hypothetical protein